MFVRNDITQPPLDPPKQAASGMERVLFMGALLEILFVVVSSRAPGRVRVEDWVRVEDGVRA